MHSSYVFLSSESDIRALSTHPDGANLPNELNLRGFYTSPITAKVIPFRKNE
jgi:hypothetical protein